MNNNLVSRFLEEHNYDVRISGNGRWIDQKCAFDAVCFVADCIMDYIQNGGSQPFQSPNIWKSEYAITNVQNIFCKPDPLRRTTLDEYNKFFRQPMKMLAAAGVLREDGVVRNTIQFSVANMDILQYIALRERNAFDFLCLYIEKTLRDSGLWDSFETFFDEQTNDALHSLKDTFANSCKYHKKGTAKGKISPSMITYDKIIYNQTNWRDDAVGKDKNVARGDFVPVAQTDDEYRYRVSRAIKYLRQFNDKYNDGRSEVLDRFSVGEKATHIHHIFPKHRYQEIAEYLENLIALTSGQHLQKAHPNGNTSAIDRDYQYTCLIAKTDSIRKNLMDNHGEPVIYDFADFMYVLDVGLETDYFGALPQYDFGAVLTGIEFNF